MHTHSLSLVSPTKPKPKIKIKEIAQEKTNPQAPSPLKTHFSIS
jgi:hypothetical protein